MPPSGAGAALTTVPQAWSPKTLPKLLRYTTYAENDSLQNTIPTFPVYMMRNVL